MHDEKRAARQRETVTCLRDNGINKAGFFWQKGEGSRACSFCDRPPIVSAWLRKNWLHRFITSVPFLESFGSNTEPFDFLFKTCRMERKD